MRIRERLSACGLTRGTIVAVLLLLACGGPGTCNKASTFDIQAAINACRPGTVTIPAGTYTLNSQANLKSGITLQGAA